MNKKLLLLFFLFLCFGLRSQTGNPNFRSKTIEVEKDSIQIDSVSINPNGFKIFDRDKKLIPPSEYNVDFALALLIIDSKKYASIWVEYYRYPEFLTKTYTPYSESLIIEQNTNDEVYRFRKPNKQENVKIFEGLETRGFISRGLTSGNNQNAVTNSALDLEISGKLSKNVSLRARIFDTNIPVAHSSNMATIYMADNASTDASIAVVQNQFPDVKIIKNETNGGYAKGYNDALRHIDADIYCLINSDVEVTENWLTPILNTFEKEPNTAIIQPKILDFKDKQKFEYAGAGGQNSMNEFVLLSHNVQIYSCFSTIRSAQYSSRFQAKQSQRAISSASSLSSSSKYPPASSNSLQNDLR